MANQPITLYDSGNINQAVPQNTNINGQVTFSFTADKLYTSAVVYVYLSNATDVRFGFNGREYRALRFDPNQDFTFSVRVPYVRKGTNTIHIWQPGTQSQTVKRIIVKAGTEQAAIRDDAYNKVIKKLKELYEVYQNTKEGITNLPSLPSELPATGRTKISKDTIDTVKNLVQQLYGQQYTCHYYSEDRISDEAINEFYARIKNYIPIAQCYTCDQYHQCDCDNRCHGYSPCSCDDKCHGYSCECNKKCYGYTCDCHSKAYFVCQCDSVQYNVRCPCYDADYLICDCNGKCDNDSCSCNSTCFGYTCNCHNVCYEYTGCSCDNKCYGYSSCSCNYMSYGYSDCDCDDQCHRYSGCSCNNTCYHHIPCYHIPCSCNYACNTQSSCSCDNKCDGHVCWCDNICFGHSQCSCNNKCDGYSDCQCVAKCHGYQCFCNSSCFGYNTCSCNNTTYGYSPCVCDYTCYEYTGCTSDFNCECNSSHYTAFCECNYERYGYNCICDQTNDVDCSCYNGKYGYRTCSCDDKCYSFACNCESQYGFECWKCYSQQYSCQQFSFDCECDQRCDAYSFDPTLFKCSQYESCSCFQTCFTDAIQQNPPDSCQEDRTESGRSTVGSDHQSTCNCDASCVTYSGTVNCSSDQPDSCVCHNATNVDCTYYLQNNKVACGCHTQNYACTSESGGSGGGVFA